MWPRHFILHDSWVGYITEKLHFSFMNSPIQWCPLHFINGMCKLMSDRRYLICSMFNFICNVSWSNYDTSISLRSMSDFHQWPLYLFALWIKIRVDSVFYSNSVLSPPIWRGDICRLPGTSSRHIRPCLYSALHHAVSKDWLYIMCAIHFWLSSCFCNCGTSLINWSVIGV